MTATRRWDTIVLPEFKVSEMVRRQRQPGQAPRRLNNRTAARLLGLRHYAFRQYLQHLCHLWGRELCIVGEQYTTQACPKCGRCWDIGGSLSCTCKDAVCGYTTVDGDRDRKSALCLAVKHLAM